MNDDTHMLFSIGEFSRITGLTIKALRFYHEEGVLPPAHIDVGSGYRYYAARQVEVARAVTLLRELEFPVKDIRDILARQGDDEHVAEALERQKLALEEKIKKQKQAVQALRAFLAAERQGSIMSTESNVQEKELPPMLIAGIRTRGKYSDCGPLFGKLCRGAGGAAAGPPMMLIYDQEFKENDADFEACVPLKKAKAIAGAEVRELAGGHGLTLTHKGPYGEVGPTYERLFQHAKEKGYRVVAPCREVYLKGPGMIFRGNPKNYITDIQIMVERT
jgi:DNA-binding transcriptional MerR regulator